MPHARRIPDPGFAGDDGADDPALRAALTAYAADATRGVEVLLALQDARLLVPVVAVRGEVGVDAAGPAPDMTSEMAVSSGVEMPVSSGVEMPVSSGVEMPVSSGVEMPVSSGVEMGTALLTGRDGRQALLAFTGLETLAAWRADARPVPVAAALAARSALQEGAAALVVDLAGPTTYVVEGEVLEGLARGWTLVRSDDGLVWIEPVAEGRAAE
jgi:hypothetical protein